MTQYNQKEINAAFYQIIGHITINWALLERGLDRMALTIYRGCKGHLIQKRIPHPLDQKLKYIEKAFNSILELSEYKNNGINIIVQTRELSTKRHFLIHGAIKWLPTNDANMIFTKYAFTKERAKLESFELSPEDFGQLSSDIQNLAESTALFSNLLINTFLQPQK